MTLNQTFQKIPSVFLILAFHLCLTDCHSVSYSQPCDPSSEGFKNIVALKTFLGDRTSYCNINFSTKLGQGANSSDSNSSTPPANLKYSSATFLLSTGVNINLTPTVQGTIASCVATPNLPPGLSISPATCTISGAISINQSNINYQVTASNQYGYASVTIGLASSFCVNGYNFSGVCYRLAADNVDCQTTCSPFGNLGADSIATNLTNCQTVLNSLLGSTPPGGYVQWAGNFPCLYETTSPFRGIYSTLGFNANYSTYRGACPCVN